MSTTTFVWDPVNDCVISELDGTGATQAVYTNEPQQYGGVLSQRRGSTSNFLHADALGTTRLLTSTAGATTDTYLLDAWGNPVSSTGSTVNPFRWVGRSGYYMDQSTGMVYVRARMYVPTLAFFTSRMPLRVPRYSRSRGNSSYAGAQNPQTTFAGPTDFTAAISPCEKVSQLQAFVSGQSIIPPFSEQEFRQTLSVRKTLGNRKVGCPCPCENSADGCNFELSLHGKGGIFSPSQLTGFKDLELRFRFTPGIVKKGALGRQDPNACFGDYGRAPDGIMTVETMDGKTCMFDTGMFEEPTGQPNEQIPETCRFLIVSGLITFPEPNDRDVRQGNGTKVIIAEAIRRISFEFDIETFCGCGGGDELGRPIIRNAGEKIRIHSQLP